MRGVTLGEQDSPCSYLPGRTATMEILILDDLDEGELSFLLSLGYRHFGTFFFRPVCPDCHACIPIRLPVGEHRFTRSERRLIKLNKRYRIEIARPIATEEKYTIYCTHKKRFAGERGESFSEFASSFFHDFASSYELDMYDGDRLFCVSHMDLTPSCLSAVYCYYLPEYARFSPGSFAIVREIGEAMNRSIPYVYLGFFIAENRHMRYKEGFYPNEILVTEDSWQPFRDRNNCLSKPELIERGFVPRMRMRAGA